MARPKNYSKNNYYTRKDLQRESKNPTIMIDGKTGQKLIRNVYVHSGFYNFTYVVKKYKAGTGNFLNRLSKKLENNFNKEIKESKALEQQIYKAIGANTPQAIKQYLTYSNTAERVLDSLDFYKLLDEALEEQPKDNDYIDVKKIQSTISTKFSEATTELSQELTDSYKEAFDRIGRLNIEKYFKASKKEEIALNKLKNSPSEIFQVGKIRGDIGEFAALIDVVGKNLSMEGFTTELDKNLTGKKNKNSTLIIEGLGKINAKSDVGVLGKDFNFGIQVKNYNDPFGSISVHSGDTQILELFDQSIVKQINNGLNLSSIFNNIDGNSKDFEKFIQYCIINAATFDKAGVYMKRRNKKSNSPNAYQTYNAFNKEVSFITEYVNYLAGYWLGSEILSSEKQNKKVAFFYLNKKIIPMSEILTAVKKGIKSENKNFIINPSFSNVQIMTPSVLKDLKWEALKKGGYTKNWNRQKEYPDALLRIGSTLGEKSLYSIKFNINIKLKGLI